jgi:hypothetical protein
MAFEINFANWKEKKMEYRYVKQLNTTTHDLLMGVIPNLFFPRASTELNAPEGFCSFLPPSSTYHISERCKAVIPSAGWARGAAARPVVYIVAPTREEVARRRKE